MKRIYYIANFDLRGYYMKNRNVSMRKEEANQLASWWLTPTHFLFPHSLATVAYFK